MRNLKCKIYNWYGHLKQVVNSEQGEQEESAMDIYLGW